MQIATNTNKQIFFSTGGFDYLEQYLCALYGEERGSYLNNVDRYYHQNEEFPPKGTVISSLEDIREISEEQIYAQCAREAWILDRVNHMIAWFDEHRSKRTITDNDYLAIAGELGLCGGQIPWFDTFFPHVANLFVDSEETEDAINKSILSHMNVVKVMVRVMIDGMRNGQILEIYGREYWPVPAYDGAICQHYGLRTPYLDLTSDLRVALFFACCKYENGQWHPLEDNEFAEADSRKSVADLGGDSRYGVLFFAPADVLAMNAAMKKPWNDITFATGFLMRCKAAH